jgi:Protein of unknown function (DUF4058)
MPIHDWARVGAGTFHAFHTRWITYLGDALNEGVLPPDFYADPEQHLGRKIADVLTLHSSNPERLRNLPEPPEGTALAVLEAPPRVSRTLPLAPLAPARRTLTIRHTSGHRIVALIEVLSPSNKASPDALAEFVAKAKDAIQTGIHLAVIDLLPPGPHDADGIHGVIAAAISGETYHLPEGGPLTFVSYSAGPAPMAYLQHPALGDELPSLPLFLTPGRYVQLPLAATYATAWSRTPAFWREVIEGKREPPEAD